MYIDHTPLEDNLHHILREHRPGSATGVANVQPGSDVQTNDANSSTHFIDRIKLLYGQNDSIAEQYQRNNNTIAKEFAINGTKESTVEDEERYELIDVITSDETGQNIIPRKKKIDENIQTDLDTISNSSAARNCEIVFEIEQDGKSFEYIFTTESTVPNSIELERSPSPKPAAKSLFKRPLPAVIPIRQYNTNHKSSASEHRILNGTIPQSQCAKYHSDSTYGPYNKNNSSVNSDTDSDNYEDEVELRNRRAQMGFEIVNKFWQLINFNSTTKYNTKEAEKRKRRSNDRSSDVGIGHQFKYRKVENRFPKFIAGTLEEGNYGLMAPIAGRRLKDKHLDTSLPPTPNSAEMSQRRSLQFNADKPKLRKSIFATPQTLNKIIQNESYSIDIEVSDDDDADLQNGSGRGSGPDRIVSGSFPNPQKFRQAASPSNGGVMPPIDFSLNRKPTYAQTLMVNMPNTNSDRRSVSSMYSSAASGSGGIRIFDGSLRRAGRDYPGSARSIIAQERESDERDKYQQLLEKVLPAIYGHGAATSSKVLSTSTKTAAIVAARQQSTLPSNRKATGFTGRRSFLTGTAKPFTPPNHGKGTQQQQPLSSTINLDDDDNEEDNDVTFTGISQAAGRMQTRSAKKTITTVVIDDDDCSDITDLDDAGVRSIISVCNKLETDCRMETSVDKRTDPRALPYVQPVNSLRDRLNALPSMSSNWIDSHNFEWHQIKQNKCEKIIETTKIAEEWSEQRRVAEIRNRELMKIFDIDPEMVIVDDFEEIVDDEPEFIELDTKQYNRIESSIKGRPDEALISKFNITINRRDIMTLTGSNWLNDEVINFYMNLLTDRSENKHETHGYPTVYAMNTFFVPRLLQAGHSGVKRWTRKVDIFAKDIIPVPVHVGGVHWCMAIIHLKNRTIKYYDSMGTPNPNVLKALEQYLKDESMDKRKQPFDTSQFELESVAEIPRQMNGSDCGVFSCMFAEYITRDREITFSQKNMMYFREKMILEIVKGELLH